MKKIFCIVLALAMCLSLAACGEKKPEAATTEPEVLTLKLASNIAANPDQYEYQAGANFCTWVEELSGGTMKVEFYPASQLGSSTEIIEQVATGAIEMAMSIGFDVHANLDPICSIFAMPFLFQNNDHMHAVLGTDNEAITSVKQHLIDSADTIIKGYCYRPFRSTMTMTKQITAPEDFNGLTIRSPEAKANMDWLSALGASPVTISWSELFTSLQSGAAEGAENAISEFYAGNFQDIIGYGAETNHMAVTCLLTCNNTWYNKLTDEQKAVIDEACDKFSDYTWNGFKAYSDEAWVAFADAGVVTTLNDGVDVAGFMEASKDVYKGFVANGDFSEDLYNQILNFKY